MIYRKCLFFIAALLLSACSTSPRLGYGVSRTPQGLLVVQVPSQRAPTIKDAIGLSSEPMRVQLADGTFEMDDEDIDDVISQGTTLYGKGRAKTTVNVPERRKDDAEARCEELLLFGTHNYESAFVRFWKDLGSGLWSLFRFIFTGR